jgi:hypothetical protein
MSAMPSRKPAQRKPAAHKQPAQTRLEQTQLEQALEEGLEDTFPASDAIAVVQPAPPDPNTGRRTQKSH